MNIQAKRLLGLMLLVWLGQSLSGLFVQAYMWEQGGDLAALGRFNLAAAVANALAFLALGPMVKRGRSVVAVRLGLLLQVGFFVSVLGLGDRTGAWLEWLGALNGLGTGAFWVGQNILIQQATRPEDRARFWGYIGASLSFTALVGPLAGSRLVAALGPGLGYQAVFGLAAACYGLAGAISAFVGSEASAQPYRLREGLRDDEPQRPWRRVLAAHVATGFRDSILSFLPSLLIYQVTGDPRMMGNVSFLTSAVGLLSNWLTGRLLPRNRWFGAMLVSGLFQAGAALLMLVQLSVGTLTLYSLVNALMGPLMGVPFNTHTFNTIGTGVGDRRVERIVLREVCLVVGRCAGMWLILGFSAFLSQDRTATATLAIVALAAFVPGLIVGRTIGPSSPTSN